MSDVGLTYLASPYSHPDPYIRSKRYDAACMTAARLMRAGEVVFSPIAHSHPIEAWFGATEDGEFWLRQDFAILRHCARVKVLRLWGWEQSKGIARELALAREIHLPIAMIDP